MIIEYKLIIANKIIKLFQKEYEQYVLDIMNKSQKVLPGKYIYQQTQSNGESDFVCVETNGKYDAKLPFTKKQVELLTDGKKHTPKIEDWLNEMHNESAEFDPIALRDGNLEITDLKLFRIMKEQICSDKVDENIVFFFSYPVILSVRTSVFTQFAANYLSAIYNE